MWDEKVQEIWVMPGKMEKLMERTNIVLLILLFVACNVSYILLPDTIPMHFSLIGDTDDYTTKAYFFVIPSIGIFLYFAITLMSNNPMQVADDEQGHSSMQHGFSVKALILVKLAVLVACTIQLGETIRLSYKELGKPGWPATVCELLLLLVPLLYYITNRRKILMGSSRP